MLTQSMRQSLQFLQMPALELGEYLQNAALSNPLLQMEEGSRQNAEPLFAASGGERIASGFERMEFWNGQDAPSVDFTAFFTRPESFAEHLEEQLGQMKPLDVETGSRCRFLVGCLNSLGYLDCPLEELAEETGQTLFDMEQALFVLQSLDPPGVGARSLSECLLLQLAQSDHFTQTNIHLIRFGLPLLARRDLAGLAALLGVSREEAKQAAEVIWSLNPVPSRGFYTEEASGWIQPEAVVRCAGGRILVDMNDHLLPRMTLEPEYCALVGRPEYGEIQPYLREKLGEAKTLMSNLQNRTDTLSRLLCTVVQLQQEYFLHGADLKPMTMRQLADQMELSASTVSRAVNGKFIQFNGRVFPLRSLFTSALQTADGGAVSTETAKQQIQRFIEAEDGRKPLSDQALSEALTDVGIVLSRRTVAKYRVELGIPGAGARKSAAFMRRDT